MIQVYAVFREGDGNGETEKKSVMWWKGVREQGGIFTEWQRQTRGVDNAEMKTLFCIFLQ
jgi:hypothetical protein